MSGNTERKIYRFVLGNVKYYYQIDDDREQIELYRRYGLTFRPYPNPETEFAKKTLIKDEWTGDIEFGSIQELLDFIEEVGPVIIEGNFIRIYDDYME